MKTHAYIQSHTCKHTYIHTYMFIQREKERRERKEERKGGGREGRKEQQRVNFFLHIELRIFNAGSCWKRKLSRNMVGWLTSLPKAWKILTLCCV